MAAINPWNGKSLSVPANAPSTPPTNTSRPAAVKLTRQNVKRALGLAGVAALAGLGLAYGGDAVRLAKRASSSAGSEVGRLGHTGNLIPDRGADNDQRVHAIIEDIEAADRIDERIVAYRNSHSGADLTHDANYQRLRADRQTQAVAILERSAAVLGKSSGTDWRNFIEESWGTSRADLLKVRLLYGIGMALHRSARANGDEQDQQGAWVISNLFSQDGWQQDDRLHSRFDGTERTYDGMLRTLELNNLVSFSVARGPDPRAPGAFQCVAEPQYLAAMRARVGRIREVIEAQRGTGTLSRNSVLAALNSAELPIDAIYDVQMSVTVDAVWARLRLPNASVDDEVVRLALLGGRPYMSVLLVSGQGGGVASVRASSEVAARNRVAGPEFPNPATFVPVDSR